MKETKNILIVGVGGQGAILISKILTNGLLAAGYDLKQSEVHGMAQRGGSVSTQVRYGEKVYGPVFGKGEADIMIALEKMEALRYAEYLKPEGLAVINDYEQDSLTTSCGLEDYPEGCLEAMKEKFRVLSLKAGEIAVSLGSARCMNVVLFGALADSLDAPGADWEKAVRESVPPKFLELNLKAFEAGREAVKGQK